MIQDEKKLQDDWEEALGCHRKSLVPFIERLTHNRDVAEDVAQHAMAVAWREFPNLKNRESAEPWIRRIAARLVYKRADKRANCELTGVLGSTTGTEWQDYDGLEPFYLWMTEAEDPQKSMERKQEQECLYAALQRLSPIDRNILLLHHDQGYTYKEIATTLGRSEEATKMAASRARQRIRELLDTGTDL